MDAHLLRLQFVRGPRTCLHSGEDVDFILTGTLIQISSSSPLRSRSFLRGCGVVTDDLGAEVYFGDLPLPLAVRAQCRVLDRWHPLPTAAFALKTGSPAISPLPPPYALIERAVCAVCHDYRVRVRGRVQRRS